MGIGNLLGGALQQGTLAALMQQMQQQVGSQVLQRAFYQPWRGDTLAATIPWDYPPQQYVQKGSIPPFPLEPETQPVKHHSNQTWLHEQVERVRLLGREWLGGKASPRASIQEKLAKAPPGSGIPTKRLLNGDYVYVYPEDHSVPLEVLERWKAIQLDRT